MPASLSIESRAIIPALTADQAKQKQMHYLEASFRVLPKTERITFSEESALRVICLPSNSQALQRDHPGFSRGLAKMKQFINSIPAAYPDSGQPDFVFVNAGIYIRAKFRCLDLPWGKAVVMLVQYTQEAHPPPPNSDDLRIWIRGISHEALRDNGGFCISGEVAVEHPRLKPMEAACAEIEGQDEMKAMAKAEKQLESYPDDSFTPSILDIERMLREITFESGRL